MPGVTSDPPLKSALIAGSVYFGVLFGLGFALGTIRVTLVAPRIGELAATMAEVPVMLLASWLACGWIVRRWSVPYRLPVRAAMGAWFLGLLLAAEALLGLTLFGRTGAEQWAALTSPAGLLGLAAQLAAALFPLTFQYTERS